MANLFSLINARHLNDKLFANVQKEFRQGYNYYSRFNEVRLKNAISLFSPDMRSALFEIIFLLHYNSPDLSKYFLKKFSSDSQTGIGAIDLYVDNAPCGVLGLDRSNKQFLVDMREHIKKEFQVDIASLPPPSRFPVTCISSLGSIGTIAHKLTKSDLDLQVQYDIFSYVLGNEFLSDKYINDILVKVFNAIKTNFPDQPKKLEIYQKQFANLYRYFNGTLTSVESLSGHLSLLNEITQLIDMYRKISLKDDYMAQDRKFKIRVSNIEKFIKLKYPEEEIHFFVYSTENYRSGKHGSTLIDKESSGSAYEKILTYETLMPGINYNGIVPSHFLMGANINNNEELYNAIVSCIRLGVFDVYLNSLGLRADYIINLGSTPQLKNKYLAEHRGAIYWEAFKGSSGNLPKAFLNLLRLENLYISEDKNYTIIQLIKNPRLYQDFLAQAKANADQASLQDPLGLNYDEHDPFPLDEIYRIELQNQELLFDPWWVRYKMLKIYCQEQLKLDYQTKQDISLMIDVCFALHIGLVDVLYSNYTNLNESESIRIRVLNDYFENAFPALTEKRKFIEQVFQGEVTGVNFLEQRLKKLFKEAVVRILDLTEGISSSAKTEEQRIWFKFYEQNFEPQKNQIPRNIISNFHKLRGRLQIVYNGENWNFKTVINLSERGARFKSMEKGDDINTKVSLHIDDDMLKGLVYCIINKFYGAYSQQVIKMSSTLVELNSGNFNGLSAGDTKFAKVNSQIIEGLAGEITAFFPDMHVDYKVAMDQELVVTGIIFILNVLTFGRIQAIYRDQLGNYFMITQDDFKLNQQSHKFSGKLEEFLKEESIYKNIYAIMKQCGLDKVRTNHFASIAKFWINPLSVENEASLRPEKIDSLQKILNQKAVQNISLFLNNKGDINQENLMQTELQG